MRKGRVVCADVGGVYVLFLVGVPSIELWGISLCIWRCSAGWGATEFCRIVFSYGFKTGAVLL